jgi:hypothetical protein
MWPKSAHSITHEATLCLWKTFVKITVPTYSQAPFLLPPCVILRPRKLYLKSVGGPCTTKSQGWECEEEDVNLPHQVMKTYIPINN